MLLFSKTYYPFLLLKQQQQQLLSLLLLIVVAVVVKQTTMYLSSTTVVDAFQTISIALHPQKLHHLINQPQKYQFNILKLVTGDGDDDDTTTTTTETTTTTTATSSSSAAASSFKTKDYIAAIAQRTGMNKKQSEIAYKAVFDILMEQLILQSNNNNNSTSTSDDNDTTTTTSASNTNNEYKLKCGTNFGTFSIKTRAARNGRNPQTGESIVLPPTKTIQFKPTKYFKDILNNKITTTVSSSKKKSKKDDDDDDDDDE